MTSTRKNLFVESDLIARSARAFTQNTSVCPCCLPLCTENPIRLYRKIESGELAEALGIIVPRQHHDRSDGRMAGASGGAIRGDIWRPAVLGPPVLSRPSLGQRPLH